MDFKCPEFKVFDGETLVHGRLLKRDPKGRTLVLGGAAAVLLVAGLAMIEGGFHVSGATPVREAICHDIAVYLSLDWSCAANTPESHFTMVRDFGSVLILVGLAMTPAVAYRQWVPMRHLLSSLFENEVAEPGRLVDPVREATEATAAINEEVEAANRWFARIGGLPWSAVAAAIAITLVGVFYYRAGHFGVFAALGPKGDPTWSNTAYDEWWLGPEFPLTRSAFLITLVVGMYYVVKLQFVGLRVVMSMKRLRRQITFSADPDRVDEENGYMCVNRVLLWAYTAAALHSLAVFIAFMMLPAGAEAFLVLLLVFFGAGFLAYVLFPLWLFRRDIKVWKATMLKQTGAQLAEVIAKGPSPDSEVIKHALHGRVARIRSVSRIPYAQKVGASVLGIVGFLEATLVVTQLL